MKSDNIVLYPPGTKLKKTIIKPMLIKSLISDEYYYQDVYCFSYPISSTIYNMMIDHKTSDDEIIRVLYSILINSTSKFEIGYKQILSHLLTKNN